MNDRTDTPPEPTLPLERLALGELSAREVHGDDIEARLAAIAASNAKILQNHPPERVRAEVERRVARARRSRSPRVLWLATPLAAAAVAALVWWPDPSIDPEALVAIAEPVTTVAGDPGDTRAKGIEPHLVLHRQEGERAVPLDPQAEARARDLLQISYVAAGARHGVVLSIDGGGLVTLHHPPRADASTALLQTGAVPLPQSYELDAAPDFERFVLVTADSPLDPAQVLAAARSLAGGPGAASDPLPLPAGQRQRSFSIRKVAP
ncbi:MAG TPA: hypothetical protein VGB85_28845 [Nannocystis sp.]|jgi:hypothetical protein